jgi:putative restriction endonuclease
MNSLSKYIYKFSKLRVDRSKGKPAPHKPILLLSILDSIEENEITENKIRLTPELVARFKGYWHQLVIDERFTANFSLPFYHLKSDGFWYLKTCIGKDIILTSSHSIKSFSQLKEVVDYAYFNEDLFELLRDSPKRHILRQTLLNEYFTQSQLFQKNEYVDAIIEEILNEDPAIYKRKAEEFNEEEVFVRGGLFKKEIPKIYNYTCSISGLRIITDSEIQMIDACHIIPFSESHDDTITNGLSLCPNLHRAFDRGLISIDTDFRVVVKPFSEEGTLYSIKQFQSKLILLPKNRNYWPSNDNLASHRRKHHFE